MDDNTETLQRHYDGLAAFNCGHTPAPRRLLGDRIGSSVGRIAVRALDKMPEQERAGALERLRTQLRPEAAPDGETEVSFEVTGGAPGERYHYRVAVRGDGVTAASALDEMQGLERAPVEREVDRDVSARVFAAAGEAGLFDDAAPVLTDTLIPPDSLVGILTVRVGDAVRRVVVPVVDPTDTGGEPGEPGQDIALRTEVRVAGRAMATVNPVLEALADAERHLPH